MASAGNGSFIFVGDLPSTRPISISIGHPSMHLRKPVSGFRLVCAAMAAVVVLLSIQHDTEIGRLVDWLTPSDEFANVAIVMLLAATTIILGILAYGRRRQPAGRPSEEQFAQLRAASRNRR